MSKLFRSDVILAGVLAVLTSAPALGAVLDPMKIDEPSISTSPVQVGIRFKLKGSQSYDATSTDEFSSDVTQSLLLTSDRTRENSFDTSLTRSLGIAGSLGSTHSISVTAGVASSSTIHSRWVALDTAQQRQFFETKASKKRVLTITSKRSEEFDDTSGYMKFTVAVENATQKYFTLKNISVAIHRVRPWESSIDLSTAEQTYVVGGQSIVTGSIPGFGNVTTSNGTLQLTVPPTDPGTPVVFNVVLDKLPTSDVHQLLSDDSVLLARIVSYELWVGTTPAQVFPSVERAAARSKNVEVLVLGRDKKKQEVFVTPQAGDTIADVLRVVRPDLEVTTTAGVAVISRFAGLTSDPDPIPIPGELYDANMPTGRWVIGATGDAPQLSDAANVGLSLTVAWVTNLDLVKLAPQKVEIRPFVMFRDCALSPNDAQKNGFVFSWPYPILTPSGSVVQLEIAEQKRFFGPKELPSRQLASQLAAGLEPNSNFAYANPSALGSLAEGGRFDVAPTSRIADPEISPVVWGGVDKSSLAIVNGEGALAPFQYVADIPGAEGSTLADGSTRVVFYVPGAARMPFRLSLPGRDFTIPWGRGGTSSFRYFSNGEIAGLSSFAGRVSRPTTFVDARAMVVRGYVTLPIEVLQSGKLKWNQAKYAAGPSDLAPDVAARTAQALDSAGALLPRPLGNVPVRDMLRNSLPQPTPSPSGKWGSQAWETNFAYKTCNYFGP